jgi:hypothetical protein
VGPSKSLLNYGLRVRAGSLYRVCAYPEKVLFRKVHNMMCSDKALSYLAGLGYNVIRHPDATFAPLKLLGRQGGEFLVLGSLNQLITSSSIPLPAMTVDQAAAEVNGQSSSSLKIGIGANVLGSLIGALGGNLSAS